MDQDATDDIKRHMDLRTEDPRSEIRAIVESTRRTIAKMAADRQRRQDEQGQTKLTYLTQWLARDIRRDD